jgi:hypothetical protein
LDRVSRGTPSNTEVFKTVTSQQETPVNATEGRRDSVGRCSSIRRVHTVESYDSVPKQVFTRKMVTSGPTEELTPVNYTEGRRDSVGRSSSIRRVYTMESYVSSPKRVFTKNTVINSPPQAHRTVPANITSPSMKSYSEHPKAFPPRPRASITRIPDEDSNPVTQRNKIDSLELNLFTSLLYIEELQTQNLKLAETSQNLRKGNDAALTKHEDLEKKFLELSKANFRQDESMENNLETINSQNAAYLEGFFLIVFTVNRD